MTAAEYIIMANIFQSTFEAPPMKFNGKLLCYSGNSKEFALNWNFEGNQFKTDAAKKDEFKVTRG